MKLYDCATAPSPRRVRIFIAEKGLDIPKHEVDLRAGEQLSDWFRMKNPCCTVPVLELADGTCISETMAICRYLESQYPQPPLLGRTALEQAEFTAWNRRVENEGLMGIAEAFRNRSPGFKNRAMTGATNIAQIPELAERGRLRAENFMQVLDERLAQVPFVGGEVFGLPDITALVFVDFAAWVKLTPGEDRPALLRWHKLVSAREGAVT